MKLLLCILMFFACAVKAQTFTNIFIGTSPNDGTGDTLRTAFGKINTNFYTLTNSLSMLSNSSQFASNYLWARIVSGYSVTSANGTGTNSFPAFASLPAISLMQFGSALSETNAIVSVTLSNFVFTANKAGVSNHWTAIGP